MSTLQTPPPATTTSAPETTETTIPPPPPYTPPVNLSCFFPPNCQPTSEPLLEDLFDQDPSDEDSPPEAPTTTITLSAPITIHGHGNIISFPAHEFTRMAAWIVTAVQKSNAATASAEGGRGGNVSVNLNCGITVNGQRNVVGTAVGGGVATRAVRMQTQSQVPVQVPAQHQAGVDATRGVAAANVATVASVGTPAANSAGSKRKAEGDVEGERAVKRVDVGICDEDVAGLSSSSSSPSSSKEEKEEEERP
ncbi:Pre-mRNA-splicing factor [Venturia inaequalis]|nr:Pre-mRNA-splicing factor [Venturia inaequalis]